MRLLVVDDAPDIATLLKLAFQMDGYAVDTALSGEQALELAAVHEYDYLTKPFDYEELVARVRALLRRDMRVRLPILDVADLKLDPAAGSVWQAGRRLSLSRKQFRILEYLMRRRGEVVSQAAHCR